jgi:hypothetical protein
MRIKLGPGHTLSMVRPSLLLDERPTAGKSNVPTGVQ